MEECGICFKDLENNLMLSDSDSDSDNSDDDNVTIKPKNNTVYNPISIEMFECKTASLFKRGSNEQSISMSKSK